VLDRAGKGRASTIRSESRAIGVTAHRTFFSGDLICGVFERQNSGLDGVRVGPEEGKAVLWNITAKICHIQLDLFTITVFVLLTFVKITNEWAYPTYIP